MFTRKLQLVIGHIGFVTKEEVTKMKAAETVFSIEHAVGKSVLNQFSFESNSIVSKDFFDNCTDHPLKVCLS